MIIIRTFLNILASLALMFFAAVSQAGLLNLSERDYLSSGDALITYDATTGLEWLDLTYTAGNSILDTEADASIWANGWHWASTEQTNALLAHTVLPQGRFDNHPDNLALIELLGATYDYTVEGKYSHKLTIGISRSFTFPEQDGPNAYKRAYIEGQIYYSPTPGIGCDDEPACVVSVGDEPFVYTEDYSYLSYGSWLVRDASAPEPASLALVGLGSLLVAGRRR